MTWLVLLKLNLAMELWTIPKLNCQACVNAVNQIGADIDGFAIQSISKTKNQICFSGDTAAFEAKLKEKDFPVSRKETVENCPKVKKSPWQDLPKQAEVVSTGEKFKYKNHLSEGQYTLFDFGASWCGPCYKTAAKIKEILTQRDDLAIRVIDLEAPVQKAFELPVAKQHLGFAAGIPWLVLFDKNGKKIYEGPLLDEALEKMK